MLELPLSNLIPTWITDIKKGYIFQEGSPQKNLLSKAFVAGWDATHLWSYLALTAVLQSRM